MGITVVNAPTETLGESGAVGGAGRRSGGRRRLRVAFDELVCWSFTPSASRPEVVAHPGFESPGGLDVAPQAGTAFVGLEAHEVGVVGRDGDHGEGLLMSWVPGVGVVVGDAEVIGNAPASSMRRRSSSARRSPSATPGAGARRGCAFAAGVGCGPVRAGPVPGRSMGGRPGRAAAWRRVVRQTMLSVAAGTARRAIPSMASASTHVVPESIMPPGCGRRRPMSRCSPIHVRGVCCSAIRVTSFRLGSIIGASATGDASRFPTASVPSRGVADTDARPVPVTLDLVQSGWDLTEPRLSPDGASIAFVQRWGSQTAVVRRDLGGPDRVTDGGRRGPLSLGPERLAIVGVPVAPGRGLGGGAFCWTPAGDLVVAATDGELWLHAPDARPLTTFERSCRAPAADGSHVVFVVDEAEVWRIDARVGSARSDSTTAATSSASTRRSIPRPATCAGWPGRRPTCPGTEPAGSCGRLPTARSGASTDRHRALRRGRCNNRGTRVGGRAGVGGRSLRLVERRGAPRRCRGAHRRRRRTRRSDVGDGATVVRRVARRPAGGVQPQRAGTRRAVARGSRHRCATSDRTRCARWARLGRDAVVRPAQRCPNADVGGRLRARHRVRDRARPGTPRRRPVWSPTRSAPTWR